MPFCIFSQMILLFKADLLVSISREDLNKIIGGLRSARRVWKHLDIISLESINGEFFSVGF